MDTTNTVVVLTGVIAVVVSLVTAVTATRKGAFDDLKVVVDELRKNLEITREDLRNEKEAREKLEKELATERRKRIRIEMWAHSLAQQLKENHITPVKLPREDEED
jgi:hypothetical protein